MTKSEISLCPVVVGWGVGVGVGLGVGRLLVKCKNKLSTSGLKFKRKMISATHHFSFRSEIRGIFSIRSGTS